MVIYGKTRIPERRFNIPLKHCHIIIFGETGAGKSGTIKIIAEVKYASGCKIVDIYDGASEENCYYCLKSKDPFWKDGSKRGRSPKAYPTRVLVPLLISKVPNQLPDVCKIFRIPIMTLTSDDLKALIGKQIGTSVNVLWGVLQRRINKSTTGDELLEILKETTKDKSMDIGGTKIGLRVLYNILEPMVREGLLCNSNDKDGIDLVEELKDKETITSLMLKYVPPQFSNINLRSFFVQYIARRIFEIKQKSEGRLRKRNVYLVMRELGDFLSKGGVGDMGDSDIAVRDILSKVITQGRKFRLYSVSDTQSPSRLTSSVEGQFKIVLCHRIHDFDDLDKIVSPTVKDQVNLSFKIAIGNLPDYDIARKERIPNLAVLKPREREEGYLGAFLTTTLVPQSRLMDTGEDFVEDFFSEKPGESLNIKETKDKIIKEKKEFKEYLLEKERIKKQKKEKEIKEKNLKENNPIQYKKEKLLEREKMMERIKNI